MAKHVSIVVPAFCLSRVVEECLRSIAGQDVPDFEVIVVDDGSTDDTAEIVAAFCARDDRFRLHRSEARRGVSAARNAGIELAEGAFVLFVDGDDRLLPGALRTLLEAAITDGVDIVRASHGLWLPPWQDAYQLNVREEFHHAEIHKFRYADMPSAVFAFTCWNTLFRRSLLASNHLRFDQDIAIGEDRLFNMAAYLRASSISFLKKRTYLWRTSHESSSSTLKTDSITDETASKILTQMIRTLATVERMFTALPVHRKWMRLAIYFEYVSLIAQKIEWSRLSDENKARSFQVLDNLDVRQIDDDYRFIKGYRLDSGDAYADFSTRYYRDNDIVGAFAGAKAAMTDKKRIKGRRR